MQTNFKKQDDDTLRTLINDRNRTAEEIGSFLTMRESIDSDIAELRDRLQELNDEIESTKDEMVKDAKKQEDEFTEILNSDNYSDLAREFRRLNTKIYEIRSPIMYMGESIHQQEWEVRQQRRDIVDKLLIVEEMEYENR